jgi:SAM-dependent methyltransferase
LTLERIFSVTPPAARDGLRRVKHWLLGKMSPAAYWNLAARVSAKAAICTDCVDEKEFFESGKREAELLRRKGLLSLDENVLNLGCGIGRIENAIYKEVNSILGVDVSSRMVELARQKVPAVNVRFQTVDGKTLAGIASEQFDLFVSFIVLQHIPRPSVASYIAEVMRVLKPGGRFLFQIPIRTDGTSPEPPPEHPFGMRYYLPEEVDSLLQKAGLVLRERFDAQDRPAPFGAAGLLREYEYFLAVRPSLGSLPISRQA